MQCWYADKLTSYAARRAALFTCPVPYALHKAHYPKALYDLYQS